jgi:oligoribonuclease NrnB/cAMP/cGMP phosphodiesterase (DHH superfamily)
MSFKQMENLKKLTQEEIDSIKQLQSQYNKNIFELGSAEAQLQLLTAQIKIIEAEKNSILSDLNKIGDKEKELVDSLQEKYGAGNIDLENGEISPL